MRIIDFISLGSEETIYVVRPKGSAEIYWRGNRKDFVREMTAFFILFPYEVQEFDCSDGVICLYV